jgi:anhydro-N-acetylmuramic acid kinase
MNKHVETLYKLARKRTRIIVGLMSGTSLDGLDVALCKITGAGEATKVELLAFETVDYSEETKSEIRAIFAKKMVDFQIVTLLNATIGTRHGNIVAACLRNWNIAPDTVDLVASHGQTVFHTPQILHGLAGYPNATLQIGDGDHVARATGIITLSDFRQRHVAAGGEGAPLAVYGDYFIFSKKGENRLMLNMGGIANFTFLPGNLDPSAVFVTDTGPGNTLLDAIVRYYFPDLSYDADAKLAKKGTVNAALLSALKSDTFFQRPVPKTTGPELFNAGFVDKALEKAQLGTLAQLDKKLSVHDLLATLTRFSAETIAEEVIKATNTESVYTVYMSGGGAHNPLLVKWLRALLPRFKFKTTAALRINPDAKEAVLFALLANECVAGGKTNFGNRAGVPSVSMGKISFPN